MRFSGLALSNGIFATATGYGVSFSLGGIDSEGLDRATLNYILKQIAIANRMLPEECIVFEYLITAMNPALPARPITNQVVSEQDRERTEFLKANAKFKSIRPIVTLYMPGKVAESRTSSRRVGARRCAISRMPRCSMSKLCGWRKFSAYCRMNWYRSIAIC